MSGLTRGPLGAEVYWRRRLIVLAVALLLVLGLARVLSLGSDGSDGAADPSGGKAAQAGASTSSSPAVTSDPTATPTPSTPAQIRKAERQQRKADKAAAAAAAAASQAAEAALPEAQGACSDTDVVVTPSVPTPIAGSDIVIDLDLRTRFSPACSWSISAETVALKITSGPEDIWTSQECPAAIPAQDVILRRAVPTVVQVTWNAKRSDESCSARTSWALPGFYHVLAAALAGEPTDVQFELGTPAAPQVTRTAKPQKTGAAKKRG